MGFHDNTFGMSNIINRINQWNDCITYDKMMDNNSMTRTKRVVDEKGNVSLIPLLDET